MSSARGSADARAVILYDHDCCFCCQCAAYIARHDPAGRFAFAPLGSPTAAALLVAHGLPADKEDALVLIEGGAHVGGDAVARIARMLRGPARLGALLGGLPRFVRRGGYAWVARNRGRFPVRGEDCGRSEPAFLSRRLDAP